MKKWSRKMTLATTLLGLPFVSYLGFCKLYDYERGPAVIERTTDDGIDVSIVGRRNPKFPKIRRLENRILSSYERGSQTLLFADGTIASKIDLFTLTDQGRNIQNSWGQLQTNHSRLLRNDPLWNPANEAVYFLLNGVPSQNIAEIYVAEKKEANYIHEVKGHGSELKSGMQLGYAVREERAMLFELMGGKKSVLQDLEFYYKMKDPQNDSDRAYHNASVDLLDRLLNKLNVPSKQEFYLALDSGKLKFADVSEKAKEIYEALYPNKKN